MRLPKESNKLRGYGYVEFDDRQSLIDALNLTDAVSLKYFFFLYKFRIKLIEINYSIF